MRHHLRLRWILSAAAVFLSALPAAAQTGLATQPPSTAKTSSADEVAGPKGDGSASPPDKAEPTEVWERSNLLGDIGGVRPALDGHGLSLGITEASEVLGNLTGGIRRGAAYDGLTTMSLTLDTAKAFDWPGGTFFASALQIHGRNLSVDHLLSVQTASSIEANRTTRLWELWFQQALPGAKSDVKIGQQSIDQEFITSQYASLFLNAAMGWPALTSADLYAGGPAYPLSSLGVRLRAKPTEAVTVLAGVFDDNPPGGPFFNDLQVRDGESSGTRFNLGTGALLIGEVQYAVPRPFFADPASDLPGTYKLGAWIDTGRFPDQRFDAAGLSLANPASSGVARLHQGNFSIYGVIDQMVWREAGGPRTLGVFARAMGAPGAQNLIDWGLNAGINLKAPLPGRKDDTVGIGYGWVHVSPRASDLDRDTALFSSTAVPVRGAEQFIEIAYQYQAAPWWLVQPDLQYVIDPGGGIATPSNRTGKVGDELVLGLRMTLTF